MLRDALDCKPFTELVSTLPIPDEFHSSHNSTVIASYSIEILHRLTKAAKF